MFSYCKQHWDTDLECNLTQVFANHNNGEGSFPLTTQDIAEAQQADAKLKYIFKHNTLINKRLEVSLVDHTYVMCKEDMMVISKPLQRRTVMWDHHHLQHPEHTCLEVTITIYIAMYWMDAHHKLVDDKVM
jgi:hypothetical protein